MKKFASIFLVLTVLFSLVACGEPEVKTEEKKGEDLLPLSAEELYALGCEKNEALMSAEFETVVTKGEEESYTVKTVRIRKGYDGFLFSRTSPGEEFSFYEDTAYQKNADGAFSAPATARVIREYTEEFFFPIGAFGADLFSDAEKKALTVSYEIRNSSLLSRFTLLSPDFVPALMEGNCVFDEEGILKEEEFTVSGTENGAKQSYTLKTTLLRYRSSEIEIQKPENPEAYVALGDIRLPAMIKTAFDVLRRKEQVQATFVSANTLLAGEKSFSFHKEVTAYQTVAEDRTPLAYLTRQSLKKVPEKDLESLFYQRYIAGGVQKENSYNVITAELLSENESSALSLPWPGETEGFLPQISDFKTLVMTEDSVGYSIRFALTDAAQKRYLDQNLKNLPEAGEFSTDGASFSSLEGTMLISRDLCLTALSFSVDALFPGAGGESLGFDGNYSMNVDAMENITVPGMQVPTPTTPDMVPEGAVD